MKKLIFFLASCLVIMALHGSVSLMWDLNTEPDIYSYRIYYSAIPGSYNSTNFVSVLHPINAATFNHGYNPGELEYNTTYYFVATAINTSGLESDYSNEINHVLFYEFVPLAPQNFQVLCSDTILLTWDQNPESNIALYKVYYSTVSCKYTQNNYFEALWPQHFIILDFQVSKSTWFYFVVSAENVFGNDSDFSNEVFCRVKKKTFQPSVVVEDYLSF